MDNFNFAVRALKRKENVEQNLKIYLDSTDSRVSCYAFVNLALHAVSLAQAFEDGVFEGEGFRETALLLKALSSGELPDPEAIRALREENISRMQRITDDVDIYTVCEYLVNRLEYRYRKDAGLPEGYSDQAFASELLTFLSNQKDEAQNLYTLRFVEQLPIRMTRNRFLELLSERLTAYRENDRNSFDEIMLLLRSASGINEASDESLRSLNEALSHTPSKEFTEEVYRTSYNLLMEISQELNSGIDSYQLLQEVLNDLLALVLTWHESDDFKYAEHCRIIINGAAEVLLSEADRVSDEAFDACGKLEGLPEVYIYKFREALGFWDDFLQRFLFSIRSHGFLERFENLRQAELLLSNSLFAPLKAQRQPEMTPEYFESTVREFLEKLSAKLSDVSIFYGRAVMARVFSILPPHFASQEELETYLYDSLRSCTDEAEKAGTVDLLKQIMAELA